jgi:hypothetical protein
MKALVRRASDGRAHDRVADSEEEASTWLNAIGVGCQESTSTVGGAHCLRIGQLRLTKLLAYQFLADLIPVLSKEIQGFNQYVGSQSSRLGHKRVA